MADLYIVRIQRSEIFGRKRKQPWVLHDFFTEESKARTCYAQALKKNKHGVRLYRGTIIEERET